MPSARFVEGTPEQWARVATQVVLRRAELHLTQKDVVALAGGSASVWSQVENGHPQNNRITRHSASVMCKALKWAPTSIEQILIGGDPLPTAAPTAEPTIGDRVSRLEKQFATQAADIAEVKALVEQLGTKPGAHGEERRR